MSIKIAHLADVHFRGLSRHAEYKEVFEALFKDLESKNVDRILVVGDLFHTKTLGISPEFIDLITWWFKELSSIAPVIVTLGNHDGNCVNLTRQDAISPLVSAINRANVRLYKRSGVYDVVPGVKLCVFSIFDKVGWKNVSPQPGVINVATYHGPVIGSKSENEYVMHEGVDVSFFDGYDFVMLGDIHRMQYLAHREATDVHGNDRRQRPWMAYPGSAIQQNYAESLVHGYLLWDIESADAFDVEFIGLPNPRPYVTIDWNETLAMTLNDAMRYPDRSRFRIRSNVKISQSDTTNVISTLNRDKSATEVTFQVDKTFESGAISVGRSVCEKTDLRSSAVLCKLLREFYADMHVSINDDELSEIDAYVERCVKSAVFDDVARNTKWTIKNLKFDNLFAFGEKNEIAFDKLDGIIGVFGPNRIGKSSSVPGALMYALHNSSDRGKLKNIHIINVRKQYCYARVIIGVDGVDYVLERQTVKRETKKGELVAYTMLNAFRVTDDAKLVDLCGEQRIDTEKLIRGLIGTEDDFCATSLSAQGEHNNVISMGSSSRKLILAKFLDLNVFDRLCDVVRNDMNVFKAQLKSFVRQDWDALIETTMKSITGRERDIDCINEKITMHRIDLDALKASIARMTDVVTIADVEKVAKTIRQLESSMMRCDDRLKKLRSANVELAAALVKCDESTVGIDVQSLRAKSQTLRRLEASSVNLKHVYDKERGDLARLERSMETLSTVPCGDSFPACRFIRDAHADRARLSDQREVVAASQRALDDVNIALDALRCDEIDKTLEKYDEEVQRRAQLVDKRHDNENEIVQLEASLTTQRLELSIAESRHNELQVMVKNQGNCDRVTMEDNIEKLSRVITLLEQNKLESAKEVGKLKERIEKLRAQRSEFERLSKMHRTCEFVFNAFSKRGIPMSIVNAQLPMINHEISVILQGIVDFTIELNVDQDSNDLDIFINYGDSKRVIELGSGMEKMISSIAIRVALTNVSALPRCDTLIIDEGFGALDAGGVEAVNRLLESLRSYYRQIIVITHVDGVKDVVDHVLEITKSEKDSQVVYV